jgi:peptidoglycan-associated lipoprotein
MKHKSKRFLAVVVAGGISVAVFVLGSCLVPSQSRLRRVRRRSLRSWARRVWVVKRVPPRCRVGATVRGWAHAREDYRTLWHYAMNDLRNTAARRKGDGVLFLDYRNHNTHSRRYVEVMGRILHCAKRRGARAHRSNKKSGAAERPLPATEGQRRDRFSPRGIASGSPPPPPPPPSRLHSNSRKRFYRRRYRSRRRTRRRSTSRRARRRTVRRRRSIARGGGRCYSDSECPGGVCRSNRCTTAGGKCYSDRECGGGVCRSNRCTTAGGKCYSDRECPGGVCRSNKCTTAGGKCYSDRECGGGVCRSNRCTTAGGKCYSDRECPGGVCRSNKCTTAGGKCYSDSECGGGTCRNGRCN